MRSLFQESMLEKDEKVVIVARPHPLIIFSKMLTYLVLAISPFLLTMLVRMVAPERDFFGEVFPTFDPKHIRFFLGSWWLLVLMGAFRTLTAYYLDVWIVTNRRVIDIEQHGFFSREVSSVFLPHVQDATTHIRGLLPTLLNYGDVDIQSAGANHKFRIRGVPHPRMLRDTILAQANNYIQHERNVI